MTPPPDDAAAGGASGSGGAPSAWSATAPGPATSTGGDLNPDDPFGCLVGDPPYRPGSIPDGYLPWTCWSQLPGCTFYLPDDLTERVAPVEWVPCERAPEGLDCRQMATPWEAGGRSPVAIGPWEEPGLAIIDGRPTLRMMREVGWDEPGSYSEIVVADVDGPVRFAMRAPRDTSPLCWARDVDLRDGFLSIAIVADGTEPVDSTDYPLADGTVLVDLADRVPRLVRRDEVDMWSADGYVSDTLVALRTDGLTVHDHALESQEVAWPRTGRWVQGKTHVLGESVLFQVSGPSIHAWSPELGTTTLVGFEDPDRGAGAVGSDGVDLVWMEGSDRDEEIDIFRVRDIMTASWTPVPTLLAARRVRSDPARAFFDDGDAFRVGCGMAARHQNGDHEVEIVRLEDGHTWYLDRIDGLWRPWFILGLTCTEIFIMATIWPEGVAEADGTHVMRIALDSLGTGEPGD